MPELTTLSRNLKKIRSTLGLSQGEFAYRCGISIEILSLIERQKTDPKLSTLQHISAYTGLTVATLLDTDAEIDFLSLLAKDTYNVV